MGGEAQWGHGGSDPGSNTNGSTPTEISAELLRLALDLV